MFDRWGGAWGASWGKAWGGNYGLLPIADTDALQKPVDFYLHDRPRVGERVTAYDTGPRQTAMTGRIPRARAGRLGAASRVTTTTGKRGY